MSGAERQLWGRWKREGRGEAFEELVRPHLGFAYSLARSIGCGHEDAEDCVQRVLFLLARERPDLTVGIRAWLGRAVALEARMLRRSDRRRDARERRVAPAGIRVEGPEPREEVEAALRRLPDREREAVELRYLHDLDYREIARFLGASPLACRLRVHRGLRRLRRQLGHGAPMLLFLHPRHASLGGILMTTTGKVALGVGVALSAAAIVVGGASILGRDEPAPARAEATRAVERPSVPDEARPGTAPDPSVAERGIRAAEAAMAGVPEADAATAKQLEGLEAGTRALEVGLRAIAEAESGGAPKRPDPTTRRYLDELADTCRRLPEGEERARAFECFAAAYPGYVERTGDQGLEPFLGEILDRSSTPAERQQAGEALVGRDPTGARLIEFMESRHVEVRRPATSALPWVRGPDRERARERLYRALDDADRSVRWNAALGLGAVAPGSRTRDALLDRLGREDDPVAARVFAQQALKLDPEEARGRLEQALPGYPEAIRAAIADVLGPPPPR